MESFQRKPNGGNSSSAAPADDTTRQKATNPVGRIRFIAQLPLKLTTQFVFGASFQFALHPIFDPQSLLIGIPKAAKMRARVNSVNSLRHRNNFGVNCARRETVWSSGARSV
jgi:hypothetical protein